MIPGQLVDVKEPKTIADLFASVRDLRARMSALEEAAQLERSKEIARRIAEEADRKQTLIRAVADHMIEQDRIRKEEIARFREENKDTIEIISNKASPISFLRKWCEDRGVSFDEITGKTQRHPVIKMRHEAVKAVYQRFPGASLNHIGTVFNRDHATIIHVLKKMGLRS